VAHVEAGLRSFDARMPEEVNRRLTDHVSSLLFCPTPTAVKNLKAEGIRSGVHCVGDVMMDAVRQNLATAKRLQPAGQDQPRRGYLVLTLHRQENVDDPARLESIVEAVATSAHPVLFPVHPRTRKQLAALGWRPAGPIRILPPVPYLEMLHLVSRARGVLTDSGGLQKEAFILKTPCVTLRDTTEWVETLRARANQLVGADPARIARAIRSIERRRPSWEAARVYGSGRASEKTAAILERFLSAR
jgi:UDP-N-acetylglucosamine 2-epimerase